MLLSGRSQRLHDRNRVSGETEVDTETEERIICGLPSGSCYVGSILGFAIDVGIMTEWLNENARAVYLCFLCLSVLVRWVFVGLRDVRA